MGCCNIVPDYLEVRTYSLVPIKSDEWAAYKHVGTISGVAGHGVVNL